MQFSLPLLPAVTFHLYGLILGIAVVTAFFLISRKAKKYQLTESKVDQFLMVGTGAGFIGARLWHVITDFTYYANNLVAALYIWRGGLSIIGGIISGLVTLFFYAQFKKEKITDKEKHVQLVTFLDCIIFGLPVAQAVGRLGNYVNYELYGSPSKLPWAIFIPLQHRLTAYQLYEYYHPLFAYEAVLLLVFAIIIWWSDQKKSQLLQVGTGRLVLVYLTYYSIIRFLLDFLRIDTATKIGGILGINQVVLLVIGVTSVVFLWRTRQVRS